MKTMHHFCDNCLNYCSEWMAHLGWSLLSLSEKRHLLSLIYFVPSVQHGTLLLRPPNLVIRLHWVSGGPCVRQLSGHMGRVTFPQQPLPHPLQQCSCMGQPLQNFSYMACQDRFTIYSFGVSEASKQKMCVCIPVWTNAGRRGSIAPEATCVRSSRTSAWVLIQAMNTRTLCRTAGLFSFIKFLPVIGQRRKMGVQVGIQVPIYSSNSDPCGERVALYWWLLVEIIITVKCSDTALEKKKKPY